MFSIPLLDPRDANDRGQCSALPVFIRDQSKAQTQNKFTKPTEVLPPYDYPKPLHLNPTASFTTSVASLPVEKEMPFRHYQGLASTPSLAAGSSTPSSPTATSASTPIYDRFARRPFSGPVSVTDSIPPVPAFPWPTSPSAHGFPSSPTLHAFPAEVTLASTEGERAIASTPTTPRSPAVPLSPTSPTDSMFSHDSEQSAVSLSFTDIEAAYGARVPSFVSLEVEQSSEPPTPFNLHHAI